eukprot:TRINITY_DN4032_c0_g1_i1.p2 TRINITY_DN4032_c0_g1~~TRINITY_DN4032_c0_g1_i1.p2  ORF type:complete len:367 (-),score=19.22 TRINITY_DN4032_c0_g1_i1:243-1343(-)
MKCKQPFSVPSSIHLTRNSTRKVLRAVQACASTMQVIGETKEQKRARALGYPYPRPQTSFIFTQDQTLEFPNKLWQGIEQLKELPVQNSNSSTTTLMKYLNSHNMDTDRLLMDDMYWTPVLAIGSNASPSQLLRKYPKDLFPEGVVIPVVQSVLMNFDVCYSPMITSYGSCSATLEHSPGTLVEVFVTYLTPKLLQRMHETEGAYNLMEIDDVDLQLGTSIDDIQHEDLIQNGFGRHLEIIFQYNHQNGTLHMPYRSSNGTQSKSCVALKAIPAINRQFPQLSQVQMQYAVMKWLQNDQLVDVSLIQQNDDDEWYQHIQEWVDSNLENNDKRLGLLGKMVQFAEPFHAPNFKVALQLGDLFSNNVN